LNFRKIIQRPFTVRESRLAFAGAVYLALFTNKTLLSFIFHLQYASPLAGWLFKLSAVALAVILLTIVMTLFFLLGLTRPALVAFAFMGAAADFFMAQYGVLIDGPVIASVFETTRSEAGQFLNGAEFLAMFFFAAIFSLVIYWLRVERPPWRLRVVLAARSLLACVMLVGLLGSVAYKEYASFFRNNRQVRHMLNPVNSLYETYRYVEAKYFPKHKNLLRVGLDAARVGGEGARPRFVIFVLGETARADHFSLNGYERETNPRLKQEGVVSFQNAWSCGTATGTSVPCLFSNLGRDGFSEDAAENRENVLDLIQRAGYKTSWIDNNTGCKGVCARIHVVELDKFWSKDLCADGDCFDEVLLKPLPLLAADKGDHFVVLHMVGSHGPTYSKRFPKSFAHFQPDCETNQLIECERAQVINSYDNTILYSDDVLGRTIDFLKSLSRTYDTALVYVSDHGESLGENGIYLHSLPYALAPDEQKHVPFVFWMSDSFQAATGLTTATLKSRERCLVSHDFVFHTLLALTQVETREYKPELDIFNREAPCRSNR